MVALKSKIRIEQEAGMEALFQKILAELRGTGSIFNYIVIVGAISLFGWWLLRKRDPYK